MEDMAIKILFDDEDDIETNTIFNSSDILSTIACDFHVFPRDKVPRIRQFVEDTVPPPHLLSQIPKAKEQLATDKQLLLFLWYISNQESMRETAHLFGISISTVHSTLIKIIQWQDPARQNDIATSFQLSYGTHIRHSAPVGGDPDYINRKGFPSVVLQTGWPGCSHDARILRNSGIFAKAEVGQLIPYNRRFSLSTQTDNGHLTDRQSRFNRVLSSCRQSVERGIGHLKGRFRRIREVPFRNPEHICLFIMAACKLHNLCIIHEDSIEEFVDFNSAHILHPNQYQNVYPNAADGVARRNHLMNI
ncbi:hypothetical protein KUTeg_013864 [Tegillarca granosa]|uniref:DDE Tnp4 domain-containing protein n=1 Tax=Tegillarca granosa TaxID=220873 RepID=A0ABQ9EUY7_TEGGR|nr:hypothetical protein KUTeg_013864 [Tegillarca granosa]